jgi:hypothetical protein
VSQLYVELLFRYVPTSSIAGSYGSSIFSFLRNLHTEFHSDSTNLHSHQHTPTSSPAFIVYFLVDSHSDWGEMESQWCFGLHFISFVTEDVEHFFTYVSATCISSFENCSTHFPIYQLHYLFFAV